MRNLRTGKLAKIEYKIRFLFIKIIKLYSQSNYIRQYRKLLADYGMRIAQDQYYIDPSAFFDNYDYSIINIGERVTISREVLLLTHDFSVSKGLYAVKAGNEGYIVKGITIGNNCFIGARATILPGTDIGDNCIIGAGAVVKGKIPMDSIVVGNPAKVIGNTLEWGKKHIEKADYIKV